MTVCSFTIINNSNNNKILELLKKRNSGMGGECPTPQVTGLL